MPKLTCVNCSIDLRPEQNGVKVIELMHNDTKIYKIWDADLWKCPICGVEIVSGFGQKPLFEHYEEEINKVLNKMRVKGQKIIFCKEHLYTSLPRL